MNSVKQRITTASIVLGVLLAAFRASAQEYETNVVVSGLTRPTGITVQGSQTFYFTQLPTPGVPGTMGGTNTVNKIVLGADGVETLTMGEPEPTHLALAPDGTLYWTCKSAGVILARSRAGDVSLFLGGLTKPSGISVGRDGDVYFTQIPTPGVPGTMGGTNTVNVSGGTSIQTLTTGEPEPTDIVVAKDGTAYWTCKSANVILRRTPDGIVSLLLGDLNKPIGIALDNQDRKLYFTEVPTPGVPGSMGGSNKVNELDLETMTLTVVDFGDPEPTDVAVARNGRIYWTCSSAGVIVEAKPVSGSQ
jgi:ribosomal protein L24E